MRRRRFLEAAGKAGAGALLGSIPLLNGCKSSTGPDLPDEPELDPVPVDLAFTVYNHTQGLRGSFVKENVMSGTTLEIAVSDLIAQFGINDVDDMSIIFRRLDRAAASARSFDGIGRLTVPRESTAYNIFLLNIDGKELYAANEAYAMPKRLHFSRQIDIYRIDFDGRTGEERIFGGAYIPEIGGHGIVDQFNQALNLDVMPFSYGSITRKPLPNDGSGSFGYGFGECYGRDSTAAIPLPPPGYPIDWVGINTRVANTIQWQVGAGLGSMLEEIMSGGFTYLPGIEQRAQYVIQSDGLLNQKGKDFIAYLYISK